MVLSKEKKLIGLFISSSFLSLTLGGIHIFDFSSKMVDSYAVEVKPYSFFNDGKDDEYTIKLKDGKIVKIYRDELFKKTGDRSFCLINLENDDIVVNHSKNSLNCYFFTGQSVYYGLKILNFINDEKNKKLEFSRKF